MEHEDEMEEYPTASLPAEMQDLEEGAEHEKVCKVHRKGGKLCITHCEGIPLAQSTEGNDNTETEAGELDSKPKLPEKGFGGKKPSDLMRQMMPNYRGT